MERLTVKWADKVYDTFDPVDIVDNEYSKANYNKILTKLGEYEDLEEQGRLLKLLCNRGDEVYFIKSAFSLAHFPIKAKITRICGVDCDNDVMYVSNTEYNGIDRHFKQSDIGRTVFLTKSEAEAKLKELQSKVSNF